MEPVPLTSRQVVVVSMYANGAQDWQISLWLGISTETINSTIKKIRTKIVQHGYSHREVGDKVSLLRWLEHPNCRWEYDDTYLELPMHRNRKPRPAPKIKQKRVGPPWGAVPQHAAHGRALKPVSL